MPRSSSRAAERAPADRLDASGVEHLLGYLLAVAEVPTRRAFQRAIGEPFDLRPVEFTLLVLLRDNAAARARQIGPALRLPPPHVTGLLDRLAARGLLERRSDPDDGRAVQVVLTAAGQRLADQALAASRSMEQALDGALSAAERRRLAALLLKLARTTVD